MNTGNDNIRLAIDNLPDKYSNIGTITNKFRHDIFEYFNDDIPRNCLELGTYKGYTTNFLSMVFHQVYTVDNNAERIEEAKEFNKTKNNIQFVNHDLYGPVHLSESLNLAGLDIVQVVFIDADHSSKCIEKDIETALYFSPKYIIFDDYGMFPEVKRAVDDFIQSLSGPRWTNVGEIAYHNSVNIRGRNILKGTSEGVIVKL